MTKPDIDTAAAPDTTDAAPAQDGGDIDWAAEAKKIQAEARKWEKRAKENKKALDDAAPKISEYDRLVEASKSDLERKSEEASRWQQEAERWRTQSVSAQIQAFATADFAYPEDAVRELAANNYLDAGGTVDTAAIKHDLAELLERRPNWRKQTEPAKSRPPAPNPHQGSGAGGTQKLDPRQEFAAILQAGLNRT